MKTEITKDPYETYRIKIKRSSENRIESMFIIDKNNNEKRKLNQIFSFSGINLDYNKTFKDYCNQISKEFNENKFELVTQITDNLISNDNIYIIKYPKRYGNKYYRIKNKITNYSITINDFYVYNEDEELIGYIN